MIEYNIRFIFLLIDLFLILTVNIINIIFNTTVIRDLFKEYFFIIIVDVKVNYEKKHETKLKCNYLIN